MQEEQLYAECGQDERTPFYQTYCVFALPVSVLAPKVPVLRRNKATNYSTSTDPISAATETLVLSNLFKLERFAITFARTV